MLTLIYAIIVAIRNWWYDKHVPKRHDIPVLSVGNISTGGTGKTPFVIYLCNLLKKNDYKPIIVGRGYKRKDVNDVIVSEGQAILASIGEAGDEMLLVAQKTKVPVFVGNSKSKLVQKVSYRYESTDTAKHIIIVDDGFQHRKLYRDLDIVLIDNKTLNTILLPLGRLREPLHSLHRADIIMLTKGATIQQLKMNYSGKQPIFEITQNFALPYSLTNSKVNVQQAKQQLVALTGIANPIPFLDMLHEAEYQVMKHIKKSDHFNYKLDDIVKICEKCAVIGCHCIATTEKDAVKLGSFSGTFQQYNINILVFPLEVQITDEEYFIETIKMKTARN